MVFQGLRKKGYWRIQATLLPNCTICSVSLLICVIKTGLNILFQFCNNVESRNVCKSRCIRVNKKSKYTMDFIILFFCPLFFAASSVYCMVLAWGLYCIVCIWSDLIINSCFPINRARILRACMPDKMCKQNCQASMC